MSGYRQSFTTPGSDLFHDVPVTVWTPDGTHEQQPLPILTVHDGSEYDAYSGLIGHADYLIDSAQVRPFRVALVDPVWGKRNEWYGASEAYSRAFAWSILPAICERAPTNTPAVGMGTSMGALAMLACADRYPGTFDGLFLQSTSFHHPTFDGGSSEAYVEYDQVAGFVSGLLVKGSTEKNLHINFTCGDEPVSRGNWAMAQALSDQGHFVGGGNVAGGHDWESWRDAFTPHLAKLLQRCWSD